MSQYKVGDRVRVVSSIKSPFVGLEGDIVELQAQKQQIKILDQYVVGFAWGEKQVFFDIQLEHADPKKNAAASSSQLNR